MRREYRLPARPVADPRAVVAGDRWRVTVLTDGLVRLEWSPDGGFEDRASPFALVRDLAVPEFHVQDRGDHLEVATSRFRLTYDRGPFSPSGLSLAVGGGVSTWHSVWRYGEPTEDLGGTARTLDNADGPVPVEPGLLSRRTGFSVVDDSGSMLFDADGWVATREPGRLDLYVFAYGHDYAGALRAFHAVSGPVPVVPRFALGTWWSRYHPYSEATYRELVERFRTEGVPVSVAVLDMDWHLVDIDPVHGSGWTGYTWNRELFPEPSRFLAWLHERGLAVTLNVHPADGVRAHEDAYTAMARALGRDPGSRDPIPFDVTDREFLRAYFDVLHRGLEADGVDFWWVDWQSGPYSRRAGVDPLWVLNHFHYLDSARGDRRGLTFSRYAGPGSHRYPVGFSGDTVISWASLRFQPHFTATAANIGYGWWSHDLGGHFGGARDDELTTRWVQLGVFSPVTRLHAVASTFLRREPWSLPPGPREVVTAFLRLRSRLVPYLHTMNHRAATEGVALVRPLYHRWPEADEAYRVPDTYEFGSQLLVAAVTEPADRRTRLARTRAWLPPGTWVDLLSGLAYDGGRLLHLHRDLTAVPVLAPVGAVVPLDGAAVPPNHLPNPPHLEVLVVVGADGSFDLLEDDGSARGEPTRTPVRFDQASGVLTVGPATGPLTGVPRLRRWTLTLPGVDLDGLDVTATVGGDPVAVTRGSGPFGPSVSAGPLPVGATLLIALGAEPALRPVDVRARVFGLLDRAEIEYAVKEAAYAVATRDVPVGLRVAELEALDLEPALLGALLELLLARAG